jgi:hypothetical protein
VTCNHFSAQIFNRGVEASAHERILFCHRLYTQLPSAESDLLGLGFPREKTPIHELFAVGFCRRDAALEIIENSSDERVLAQKSIVCTMTLWKI